MDDVENALSTGVTDQDEPLVVERVGEVGAETIVEGAGRLVEGDAVLLEIRRSPAWTPDEFH